MSQFTENEIMTSLAIVWHYFHGNTCGIWPMTFKNVWIGLLFNPVSKLQIPHLFTSIVKTTVVDFTSSVYVNCYANSLFFIFFIFPEENKNSQGLSFIQFSENNYNTYPFVKMFDLTLISNSWFLYCCQFMVARNQSI